MEHETIRCDALQTGQPDQKSGTWTRLPDEAEQVLGKAADS
jgi:hypothetical protein